MKTKKALGNNFSMLYYINKSRPDKQGECPIYVRLVVNSTQTAFSIKCSVNPSNWSTEAGQPVGSSSKINEIKSYMMELNSAFLDAYEELAEESENITAQALREKITHKHSEKHEKTVKENGKVQKVKSFDSSYFFDAFKLFMSKEKELIGIDTSSTTVNRFDLIQVTFAEFLVSQKINPETYKLSSLDKKTVLEFCHYLKTVKGNNHNTAMKKVERFRKFCKYCVDYKLMDNNPFYEVRITYKKKQT